ncbi:SET and MYND domain-containing protein 4 isoform X3 [Mobula birostris]|uniref:SET and MYND domain-containing protein 4 isoform X3 n=1 Tax=Mobula birostris TaxID=1983395 RepID=UPI003B28B67A
MAGAVAEWRRVCGDRWRATPDSERRRFGSVTDPGRVFDFGRRWLVDEDVAALNALSAQWQAQKDVKTAQDFKCRGNERFKGLRHCTANCLEAALLYANRSAALFHLQRYQECLEEIDRAEQHGYPSELQYKVWGRRAACLRRLDQYKEGPRVPGAQTPLSGEVEPNAPPSVSLQWDTTQGRHYIAARDLQAGEVVLQEEAFATVVVSGSQPSTQDLYCHLCLRPTDLPLPCPQCSFSSYCSKSCRQQAWHLYHWLDCPLTGLLLTLGSFAHLALRTVLTAGLAEVERLQAVDIPGQEWGREPQKATPYQTIHSLLTHSRARPPEHRFLCALSAAALCQAVRENGCGARLGIVATAEGEDGARSLKTLGVAVLRHMLQLECNGQAITAVTDTGMGCERVVETRQVRIATALYARASLFNHSCDPNTSISFHGTSIIFRASQHIPAGQEVLHCYGPHWRRLALKERRQALMSQYVFQCHCGACVREEAEGGTSLTAPFLCQHCGSVLTRVEGAQYKCSADTCGQSEARQDLCQQLAELTGRVRGASELISAQPGPITTWHGSSRVHHNLVWKLSCPRPKEAAEDREHSAAHHTNQSSVLGLTLHRTLSEQCCQDNQGHDPPSQHTFCPSSLREKAQELEDSYGQIWEQLLSNCDKTAERIRTRIWAVSSKYLDLPLGFFCTTLLSIFLFSIYDL